jgi:hypothetical protein
MCEVVSVFSMQLIRKLQSCDLYALLSMPTCVCVCGVRILETNDVLVANNTCDVSKDTCAHVNQVSRGSHARTNFNNRFQFPRHHDKFSRVPKKIPSRLSISIVPFDTLAPYLA